jgi:hypothetical protein
MPLSEKMTPVDLHHGRHDYWALSINIKGGNHGDTITLYEERTLGNMPVSGLVGRVRYLPDESNIWSAQQNLSNFDIKR